MVNISVIVAIVSSGHAAGPGCDTGPHCTSVVTVLTSARQNGRDPIGSWFGFSCVSGAMLTAMLPSAAGRSTQSTRSEDCLH